MPLKETDEEKKEVKRLYDIQYRKKNRAKRIAYNKKYREEHKEKTKTYYQKRYQENKEQLLEQSRQYMENNREAIRQRSKEYYQNNKQKWYERIAKYRDTNEQLIKIRARSLAWYYPLDNQCSECNSIDRLQRHHPDYNKPKEFITLCSLCHGLERRI